MTEPRQRYVYNIGTVSGRGPHLFRCKKASLSLSLSDHTGVVTNVPSRTSEGATDSPRPAFEEARPNIFPGCDWQPVLSPPFSTLHAVTWGRHR